VSDGIYYLSGGAVLGAVIVVMVQVTIRLVRSGSIAYKGLVDNLKFVKQSAEVNEQLVKIGNAIALELSVLRTLLASSQTGNGTNAAASGEEAARSVPAGGYPFPPLNYEFFKSAEPAPDAKESDTVLEETTDADMVAFENLDSVRQKGFEVEES